MDQATAAKAANSACAPLQFDLESCLRQGGSYIPGLDGLRAIAVTLVMIAHFGFQRTVPGGLGVTIFFFISGFLITSLLLRENETSGTISLSGFYVRRFLRLTPELYVFLALTGLYFVIRGADIAPMKVAAALLYFMNYYNIVVHASEESGIHWGHLWSLAVEEHFYLSYPLIVSLLAKRKQALKTFLVMVVVLGPLWRMFVLWNDFPPQYTYFASDARFDSIAWGCIFAVLVRDSEVFVNILRQWGLPILAFGLIALAVTLVWRSPFFRESWRYTIQGISIGALFAGLYFTPLSAKFLRILELPVMRWLGKVSYGTYLWHFFTLDVLWIEFGIGDPRHLPVSTRLALTVPLLIVSWVFSSLSYRFVHNNFLAWRRRWGSHARG